MDLRGKRKFGLRGKEQTTQAKEATINTMMDSFEESIGVEYVTGPSTFKGYLANAKSFRYRLEDSPKDCACLLLFFITESGKWIKAMYPFEPYFFIKCKSEVAKDMMPFLHKTFSDTILAIDYSKCKLDLATPNHLAGHTQLYLKLRFRNVQDLVATRNAIRPVVEENRARELREGGYYQEYTDAILEERENMLNYITEVREDDVLYHVRVMIDSNIRCSFWYNIRVLGAFIQEITQIEGKMDKADLKILAYDIETTKPPLKFPDPRIDSVMMISYMFEGQGYLIVNRSIIASDIDDFTYSPKPEFEGCFIVLNEPDEKAVLDRFFTHVKELRPTIISSFNGDNFDFPFIEERAKTYGMSLEKEIGITREKDGYMGRYFIHMDCLYWVQRDAYLPQGSHGLKAVTKAKLGYDPVELDPEDMVIYARTKPNELGVYSASDAVATYYLYKKLIHDFIIALCTIIPTYPDEVLRLGSGTLCESLLMAEAFRNNIMFPNKHREVFEKFHEGHLLDVETYIGGHVEALKNGVYRMDIPVKFRLDHSAFQELIENIDDTLKFVIEIEHRKRVEVCENYTTVREQILEKLRALLEASKSAHHECCPKIYHVDVAAMYPNIILTNRLQPVAIVNDKVCASCLYNEAGNNCKRAMTWTWRGDYFPLNRGEYEIVKRNLESERVQINEGERGFNELRPEDKNNIIKLRVKKYCEKVYKKVHVPTTEERKDNVCMRENPFYVDTVRAFRDRRYEYKDKVKMWKGKYDEAVKAGNRARIEECGNLSSMFESLQLAHKIILNSFYGYVMRRGARWYSMQMAGMVTHLGGTIITYNREFLERVGIPLELDTDGIWCLLPQHFPEAYRLEYSDGKKMMMHYTIAVLNMNTYNMFANQQYQVCNPRTREYETRTEMSVFFEVDGPYRGIVLPAAREEGKMLKKKYAVFNMEGRLQELKGFEMKRRGELNIVKIFQSEVFTKFTEGKTLEDCYRACAEVAERWYDVLDSEGLMFSNAELIEYIGEERRLARAISAYGTQKSTALTCARRLAEFLSLDLTNDKGLNTKLIIAKKPIGRSITERAIPTAIFSAEPSVAKKYLREWLKDPEIDEVDMRTILDWEYYKERLAKSIQKIITIPAILQGIPNPFPKVALPDWLKKKLKESHQGQRKLDCFLSKAVEASSVPLNYDMEDIDFMDIRKSPVEQAKRAPSKMEDMKRQEWEELQNSLRSLVGSTPSPLESFEAWLKHQQEIWKLERKLGAEGRLAAGQKGGLISYLKLQEESVARSVWHILEVRELINSPGFLKLWFIAEHEDRSRGRVFNLFSLNLHLKRTFFINARVPQPDYKQAKKVLPRAKPSQFLYEIETDEDLFLDTYANFGAFLCSPEVEGIYESGVPLSARAVMLLGSMVKPKKTKITLNQSHIAQTFNLGDFETRPMWNVTYLPSASYERILLCHSCRQLRHVIGLFVFSTKQLLIFCVHDTIKQVEKPNLRRVFKQVTDEAQEYEDWAVETVFSDDLQGAMQSIDESLVQCKAKAKQPTILIIQSPKSSEELIRLGLSSTANEFPIIHCPVNDEDMNYPLLNWQVFATKNLARRFLETEEWLAEWVNFARTAGLPVCNIELDALKYVIDMLFSKKMFLSNHILWYSGTGYPDLGLQSSYDPTMMFEEEIENVEIIQTGVYRGYCVELNMSSLAVNTILKSDVLSSIETGFAAYKFTATMDKESASRQKYDPNDVFAVCMETFGKLKSMIASWMAEIQKGNVYADRLIQHVYRWLSSPSSKMYDPALHKMVHVLMTKVFLRLLQRIKEYGGVIVYANFHKLILYTGKRSIEETTNYMDFLMKTLQSCDSGLYQFVLIEPVNYWRLLLFMDNYNYGGVQEKEPDKVSSNWNIAEFLPPAVEEIMLNIVAEYAYRISRFMQTKKDEEVERMAVEAMQDEEDDQLEVVDPALDYMKKLVSTYFTKRLIRVIPDLIHRKEEEMNDSESENEEPDVRMNYVGRGAVRRKKKEWQERWEFPQNLASHLELSSPALEFVKLICVVLGLEPELSDEVIVLKRNLLKMLKVEEFALEIHYENPSLSLVLQDVICTFCLTIRDIDICRETPKVKGNWLCSTCNHVYNKDYIEAKLVGILQRRVRAYHMQDLKCERCKTVKQNVLNNCCECTGKYRKTMGRRVGRCTNLVNFDSDVHLFVLMIKRIAHHHSLELLESITDSIL